MDHQRFQAYRDQRQRKIAEWCAATFGVTVASDANERAARLLEEAIELAQAEGLPEHAVTTLVRHVYSKPAGRPHQEVGGIGVCLLVYCQAKGLSADGCETVEIKRIMAMPFDHFRRRHQAKAEAGVALPATAPGGLSAMSPVSTKGLQALIDKGGSAEQMLAVIKAEEEEAARIREYERARKAAYRAKKNLSRGQMSRGHPGTFRDTSPSSLSSTSITTSVGVGGDLDARDDNQIASEVLTLADEVMLILGIDLEFVPLGWCGLAELLRQGMRAGWKPELVRLAAREVAGGRTFKRDGLPNRFTYLRPVIERWHRDAARPKPPVQEAPDRQLFPARAIDDRRPKTSRQDGIAAALERRIAERIQGVDDRGAGERRVSSAESGDGGVGDAGGGRPLRLVSK
jgi:hypothetical protein